jgi:translation elongation factor EF-1alpha
MIEGKIEAGVIRKDETYLLMPNRETVTLSALYGEGEEEIPKAMAGDQIRARLRNIDEESILPGFVLCSVKRPVHYVSSFDAQVSQSRCWICPIANKIVDSNFARIEEYSHSWIQLCYARTQRAGRGDLYSSIAQIRKGNRSQKQEGTNPRNQGYADYCAVGSY